MVWKPTNTPNDILMHSAKGTTWKNHKYIKKIGNAYIYAKKASAYRKKHKNHIEEEKEAHQRAGWAGRQAARDVKENDVQEHLNNAKTWGKEAEYQSYRKRHTYTMANRYERLAKKELASIPKEMISDGKNVFDSIVNKFKKKKSVSSN